VTSIATVSAASVNPEWVEAVNFMKTEGLSSVANSVEEYMPLATVTREQAAKFFVAFAEKEFGKTPDTTVVCNFTDINKANPVFVPYITKACQMGIIKGVNGKFLPKQPLMKHQFLTILARIVKNNPNLQPEEAFNLLKADGITKEATFADTVRPVSRIELAILFKRAVEKYAQTQETNDNIDDVLSGLLGDDENTTEETTNENTQEETTNENTQEETTNENTDTATENVLTVSLDPATPAEQYVPGTGSHIPVMKFDLTAGSEDVTIKSVTAKLEGMVNKDHIKNVYIEDENGVVLTNLRPFNTDFEALLVFNGDYVVKAGEVKALYLVMDVEDSVNELIKISITDIDANGTAVEGLPITSNVIHTTSYASTTVEFSSDLTGPVSNPTNTLYVGDTDKEIMKFDLTNTSNERDVIVKSIRFRNVETIEGRIDNVKLLAGGTTVDAKAIVDGKYITFNINDYVLREGDTKNFYIHADIVGGEQGDKIQLYLDETSDISAIEADTKAATRISATDVYGKAYVIAEGDNLITKSSESPASSYIPNDENDITVLVANVNTTSEIYAEKIRVYNNGTATTANDDLKRVKLYINDKFVDEGTYNETENYYEFNFYGNLKGANKFVVKVDTDRAAKEGDTVKYTINPESIAFGSNAEYVASQNTVEADEIKGEAVSSTLTIKKPAIDSITRTDGFADNEVIIAGATDALIAKYTFQANNVRDIVITDLGVAVSGDTDNISTLKLVVDGQVVDTENVNGDTVTFNSVNITVPRGGTTEVEILASLNTSYNASTLQIILNSVSAEDAKGNSIDVENVNVPSALFTVKTSATLYVSADSNTPVENVVAANPNVETEVARFKFKATDDDAQIQELTLVNTTGDITDGFSGTDTGDIYTGADSVVNTVYVYDVNGNKLGEAALADGAAYFAFTDPVELPKDQDVVLVVKVKTNAINDENNTNKIVKFAVLKAGDTLEGTTKTTKVISKANGNEVDASNVTYTNAIANAQYFRKTIITLANDPQTSTQLVAGSNDIYLFSISADAAGAAKVKELVFDATFGGDASNGTSDYELYINGSKEDNVTIEATSTTGGTITVTFVGNYENGYEISAGSTVNFKLVATNVDTDNDGDSITVRLNEKATDATIIGDVATVATGDYSIIWSDEAADEVLTGTADWFNDADLPSLPLNGQTLSN